MTRCDKCGAEAAEGLILCPSCGHKLPDPNPQKIVPEKQYREAPEVIDRPKAIPTQSMAATKPDIGGQHPDKKAIEKLPEEPKLPEEQKPIAAKESDKKKVDMAQILDGASKLDKSISPSTPYIKKPKSPTFLIIALIVIFGAAIAVILMMNIDQIACHPDWACGSWQGCREGVEIRTCLDKNECNVNTGRPETRRECDDWTPVNTTGNETSNDTIPTCSGFGDVCGVEEDCCEGFCLHGRCWPSDPYCGDGYCDPGENCITCEYDCGACPTLRELGQNVYTEPLSYTAEQELKEEGYVLISYFYYDSCSPCFYPVHIENELRDLAASMKDLAVFQFINTIRQKTYADFKGKILGRVYTPSIIIEGGSKPGNDPLYSGSLSDLVNSGDLADKIKEMICERSEYCRWDERITRTYEPAPLIENIEQVVNSSV
jgi:hypothetical protein